MFEWQLGVMMVLCLVIGGIFGALISGGKAADDKPRARRQRKAVMDAPVPAGLGYDPMNPMNGARTRGADQERETVEICGATWYRM